MYAPTNVPLDWFAPLGKKNNGLREGRLLTQHFPQVSSTQERAALNLRLGLTQEGVRVERFGRQRRGRLGARECRGRDQWLSSGG